MLNVPAEPASTAWCRRCALCGIVDDTLAGDLGAQSDWACRRCSAVRYLWEPATERPGSAWRATG